MKIVKTIPQYYKEINIPVPRHSFFHVGRHQDNMPTIKLKQEPVKHELYSVSLSKSHFSSLSIDYSSVDFRLFFISPFKTISWDITHQQVEGWYIIFDRSFIEGNPQWKNFTRVFPFFRTGSVLHINPVPALSNDMIKYYEMIFDEYQSEREDKFELIKGYVHLMLLLIKRQFIPDLTNADHTVRRNYQLLGNFEHLLTESISKMDSAPGFRKPSFYASSLHVHINHLNAIIKQLTGKTTSQIIHDRLIHEINLLLRHSDLTSKEIASRFQFSDSTQFISFFKRHTGLTPGQFKSGTSQ